MRHTLKNGDTVFLEPYDGIGTTREMGGHYLCPPRGHQRRQDCRGCGALSSVRCVAVRDRYKDAPDIPLCAACVAMLPEILFLDEVVNG